ncbi:MAG: PEGA domain-containing protein [Myxococcaceae bacterium]|nr:PEGA domain-containing protein [Myxococcaceae bacterium]
MTARRLVLALVVTLLPMSAFAQLDDLLTPLTPTKKEAPKHKSKKKRRPHAKKEKRPEKEEAEPVDLIAPLVPAKGELVVQVIGPKDGAQISIDGQKAQEGKKVPVDAGEHTVVVKRPGWADYSKQVTVAAGKTVEISATLEAVAGVLTVSADVPGAEVLLDGRSLGEVPIRNALVPPGVHEVLIRRDGFEDTVSRISVRAGRDYTVDGALKPKVNVSTIVAQNGDRPERPQLAPDGLDESSTDPFAVTGKRVEGDDWYKRWYVWAGAGAVVIAAATTAVLASSSAGAHRLTPGEVCDLDPSDGQPGTCDDVINAPAALLRLGAGFGMRF